MRIDWAGETLELRSERALFWPRRATTIVSDLHFGKPATFRQAGVPVPEAVTTGDLDRLERLVRVTRAERLILLGDFFHARIGRARATLDALRDWRARHETLDVMLVRGNHDHHAGDPPASWRISCVTGPLDEAPFVLAHDPDEPADGPLIAGHLHPAVLLRAEDGSRLRMPCFHVSERTMVLPAFGTFTGTHRVRPRRGDRVFVVGEDAVVEAPVGD